MIGTLSFGFVMGLRQMGVLQTVDTGVRQWWSGLGEGLRESPLWVEYGFLGWMSYVVPALMLHCPAMWRKWVIWWGMMFLCAVWFPVLVLASWVVPPSGTLVAGFWSGLCAMIYASRHRLPCEQVSYGEKGGEA